MEADIPEPYELSAHDDFEVVALPDALEPLIRAAAGPGGIVGWAAERADALPLGRGARRSVPGPDGSGRWAVRRYRRRGTAARLVGHRFLEIGRRRPVRELRASAAARARGIDTPEVIGVAVYPQGVWYRADVVTRLVPDSRDLSAVLFGTDDGERAPPETRRRTMGAVGAALRHAHENGLVHNDLDVTNMLLSPRPAGAGDADAAPRVWLLDLDRAVVARDAVARFERDQMLRRFARSLRAAERGGRQDLDAGERETFARAYAGGAAVPVE